MNQPQITVHHVRETGVQADLHLYCGRPGACKRTDLIDAKLGNPFPMRDESQRNAVCDNYEAWLEGQPPDGYARKAIHRLAEHVRAGKTIALYCFCSPKRCHTESIRDFALGTARTGL